MAFEIVHLEKEVFSGEKVEIPEFNPQEGFSKMSEIKTAAFEKYADNSKNYVGINAAIDGKQNYIVAKSGDGNGVISFEVPEGDYAKFVTEETERTAIDNFIGQTYGEVMQGGQYDLAGNFNLEDLREDKFTIYIPVNAK